VDSTPVAGCHHVVDWARPHADESKYPALAESIRAAAAALGINPIKPDAPVGVASLGRSEWPIEISATVVTT
jgi:hypothetical protein